MLTRGIGAFPYYLGIGSLADVATRADRVCVLNILGGESRQVTPFCHVFSGGNVAFGTSPGRSGQKLATSIGDIPVFNNVREGLDAGHVFNTGVVYLPPSGVRDGVAELIRVNRALTKIVIVTEKISVHDAREVRAMGQSAGIDIFGGNCLGMADSWNRVRIGGALGGDAPAESLLKGSVAIFSNSGGFTTTIAQYLANFGWGTTTLISSGKDVYIHYGARDFAYAFNHDERSKAAVMYVEPGGYYERDLDLMKPTVVCVVGRWKSRLTRAVGHAGAMAGAGDSAEAKEGWLMDLFGVDGLFTAETPIVSSRGAVVTNIADIPAALTAVMKLNGIDPDFAARGDLSLKPWIANDQGIALPAELALPPVTAPAPYDAQLAALARQVGAVVPRQNMRATSGASMMEVATQVTSVHRYSVLDLALQPLSAVFALPLTHEIVTAADQALIDIAVGAEMELAGDPALAAAEAARVAGNSPNTVMAAAIALIGPARIERALDCTRILIDAFAAAGIRDAWDSSIDVSAIPLSATERALFAADADDSADPRGAAMLAAIAERGATSVFVRFVAGLDGPPSHDAVLAAIATTLAWGPLTRKRISRLTAETLPWYLRLYGVMIGASISTDEHGVATVCGIPRAVRLSRWSMVDLLSLALTGKAAGEAGRAIEVLVGLLVSNGPGAISAQGAKGAVSADGPQTPRRVHLNKAVIGFLTHTGFSHGGNGFEGIVFLIDRFRGSGLTDPSDRAHGLDLRAMALDFAKAYRRDRRAAREAGSGGPGALPGVHHPVFRGEAVNHDPRERFIASHLAAQGEYNVFHDFYGELVRALHDVGASDTVFCVNIDGVIAALLLAIFWEDYVAGRVDEHRLEVAAFNVFLFGRMIGAIAEIDDHLNRGRNMDMRTPQETVSFVA